jgi:hypothetical protein
LLYKDLQISILPRNQFILGSRLCAPSLPPKAPLPQTHQEIFYLFSLRRFGRAGSRNNEPP